MRQIPIQLLHALSVFSRATNLKEAALDLGLSQPGLSKQLALLDSLLPQSAFSAEGKRKILTPYGRSIALEFEKRFTGFNESLSQITSAHTSPELATVRIAGRREILDRFSDELQFPGRMIFSVLGNLETAEALLRGSLDFGVTWRQPDSTEIVAKPLFTERYQIVIPKSLGVEIDSAKSVESLAKLLETPSITYKENDEVFRRFFSHYKLSADDLTVIRTTANYQTVARMIESGIGWSIVPIHYEFSKARNWILPISESVGLSKQFYLVYRRQISKLEWARKAIEEIQSCFKSKR